MIQTVVLQWCERHPENARWTKDVERVVTVNLPRGTKTLTVEGQEWQETGRVRGMKRFQPVQPWKVLGE